MFVSSLRLPGHSGTVLWLWTVALIMAAMALSPTPASAGVVSETAETFAGKVTDDPTAQKEIGNAVDALVKLLPAAKEVAGNPAAKGTAGVSGPFEELVVNFDKMACAAWIISYRDFLLGLMLKRDPETPPETLAAAQDLLNKVIFGCRKILDPDTNYGQTGTTGGGGAAGGGDDGSTSSGPSPEVIDGELVISTSDHICWNRCRDKWAAWKSAEGMRARAEQRMREARRHADTLERDTIPWTERRLARARSRLADLQARKPKYPRADPAIDRSIAETEVEIANLTTELAKMRADVTAKRQEARALEQALPGLRQAEQAALQAYLDCLKACAAQATAAGDPSSFADKTIGKLERLLRTMASPTPVRDRRTSLVVPESAETRRARLEAIGQLRTGIASTSGTEVVLAIPVQRDPLADVRADLHDRLRQARSIDPGHGSSHFAEPPLAEVPIADSPGEEVPGEGWAPVEEIPAVPPVETAGPVEVIPSPPPFECPEHPGMGPHAH